MKEVSKNDLITVIVPVFRVENYLNRCVDSILCQTYRNIEIILVDDGSDDACPKICDDYATLDSRVKVIHQKNGGLSDARNTGIAIANGEYLTFIDSDDFVDKDYVEVLYNAIIENHADISICAYQAVYDTGAVLSQATGNIMVLNPKETLEKMLYQEDFNVSTWAKMYKRKLFDHIRFPKGKIFEDSYTTYKLVLNSDIIACDMQSKYNYMIRSNSILTSHFSKQKLLLVDAYEEMGQAILEKYPDLNKAVLRGNAYARISTLRQMMNCKPRLQKIEKDYRHYILEHRGELLRDARVPRRDKLAIIILLFGMSIFKFSWRLYCRFTGRNL